MSLPGEAGRFCDADMARRDQFERGVYTCCEAEQAQPARTTLRERFAQWLGRSHKPNGGGSKLQGSHGLL
jgi:hypothetical protein